MGTLPSLTVADRQTGKQRFEELHLKQTDMNESAFAKYLGDLFKHNMLASV